MLNSVEIVFALFAVVVLSFSSLTIGLFYQILVKRLLGSAVNNGVELSVFWKLIIGNSVLLSVFAIFQTKGITMLALIPILLIFATKHLLTKKTDSSGKDPHSKQPWFFYFLSIAFNFLFYLWAIQSFDINNVHFVSGDFNIYYRIAQRLNDFGIETLNLNPIYTSNFAAPYHYGDLWLYAFGSRVFHTNPSFVFLVSFTHLSILFVNGIYTYAYSRFDNEMKAKRQYLYLLLFAGLFTGFNFFFPTFIVPSAEPYTLSVMNWSKVLTPSCFIIALLFLAYSQNWWAMCFIAMVGALSFINAMPAIFMSVFLILFVALRRKQISFKSWLIYHLLYVGVTVLFLVFLYKILPLLSGTQAKEATGVTIGKSIDIKVYLTTAVKIFIGGWFQLFVLTPFFLIFIVGYLVKNKFSGFINRVLQLDNDILFVIFIVLSGLSCWAILHPFAPDAVQFYTNILAPTYAIVVAFILCYVISFASSKLLKTAVVALVFVSLILHRQDVFFVQKGERKEWLRIEQWFSNKKMGYNFVNLRPARHFNSFFDKNTIYFMPLGQLMYLWPNYHNFSLNAPFIKENISSIYAEEERIELEQAPFSIYFRDLKAHLPNIEPEEAMQSFIGQHKISYISVSKDTALPAFLRSSVKDSLVLNAAQLTVYQIR